MALLTNSLVMEGLIAAVTLLAGLYYYLTATFDYWAKRGVPFVKPQIFFGNLRDHFFMRKSLTMVLRDIYYKLEGHKYGGCFESSTPVLMVRDPDLVQTILIKDFSHFSDRDFNASDLKVEPLTRNLFNLKGHVWSNLRNKLSPTFSTWKLKGMMDQMRKCGEWFLNEIEKVSSSGEAVEAKMLASIFSIDVIASCLFGLQFKSDRPEGKQFRQISNDVFGASTIKMLRHLIVLFMWPIRKLLRLRQFPKPVNDYIINLVKSTMEFRKKNNIVRNDFLQLMMNLQDQEKSGKEMNWKSELSEEDTYLNHMDLTQYSGLDKGLKIITDECIAAQSFVFLTVGSEVTSNVISLALYELAVNPDIKKKVLDEIDQVLQKSQGKLTYEALKDMTYLDLVIQETNRKYSITQFLQRVCVAPYKLPGTDIVIEKGVRVVIPMDAIHNDPNNYPDPEKFIPERFEGNNYHSTGTYLAFGDGPRVCIAMKFAILELKACLAIMLSQYSVSLDSRTLSPIQLNPKASLAVPIGGIWLKFHKRTPAASPSK